MPVRGSPRHSPQWTLYPGGVTSILLLDSYLAKSSVTNDRSEARVDPLAALIVQGQNRQISSRGFEGNVDKTESKSEAEQWVRAGGRQRGLPVHRRGQRGRQQTIRRGSQQSR